MTYRTGNHQPQNLYRDDRYIGVMFSAENAALVVEALNETERVHGPALPIVVDAPDRHTPDVDHARGAAEALAEVLRMLDGWIEGAKSNHEGLGHRGEPMGEECWTQFHPNDIRNMVADAARQIGVDASGSLAISPQAAEQPSAGGSGRAEAAETPTARCTKCGTPRNPCTDCGKPSQCGDLWCADCEPGWGES